jgi:hypothetical protein
MRNGIGTVGICMVRRWLKRALTRKTTVMFAAAPMAFVGAVGGRCAVLPDAPGPRGVPTVAQSLIEHQPVCIGSSIASAGELNDVLYYRAVALDDGRVAVGYFAFFSEERPWGNNWMTWSFVPALGVDLVYSRALLVAPGLQRALYGAGDVEGVQVVYDVADDGSLRVDHAVADDRDERPIVLSREDALAIDPQRPTFYSEVWSHQLGARGVRSRDDLAYVRCYEGDAIRPLPESVAQRFRLENRAGPAHVEQIAGRRIDVGEAPGDFLARVEP